MHVEHDTPDADREHDDRADGDEPRPQRSAHDGQQRRVSSASTPTITPSACPDGKRRLTAARTNASAGRGRSAAVLAASVTSPLSSTLSTRNIATRTLRRVNATTITTKAISRKAVGPRTVQNTSHDVTHEGWTMPYPCSESSADWSMASNHVHCCTKPTHNSTYSTNANTAPPTSHFLRMVTPQRLPRCRYGAGMAVLLRKLLRIGGLPAELRAHVDAEGILYLAEYVPVTRRFSGSVPGKRAKTDIASYVGSLVLTPQRVLGTLSSVPKLAARTIDQRWDAPQSGPVKADISTTGLHIEVEHRRGRPEVQGASLAALQDPDSRRRPDATAPTVARVRGAARLRPSGGRRARTRLTTLRRVAVNPSVPVRL